MSAQRSRGTSAVPDLVEAFHGTADVRLQSITKAGLNGPCFVSTEPLIAIAYGVWSAFFIHGAKYTTTNLERLLDHVVLLRVRIGSPDRLSADQVFVEKAANGSFRNRWHETDDDFGFELLDRAFCTEVFDLGNTLDPEVIQEWWDAHDEPVSGRESLRMLRSACVEHIPPSDIQVVPHHEVLGHVAALTQRPQP